MAGEFPLLHVFFDLLIICLKFAMELMSLLSAQSSRFYESNFYFFFMAFL